MPSRRSEQDRRSGTSSPTFRPGQTTVKDPLGTLRTYTFVGVGGLNRLQWVSPWCPTCIQYATYDANANVTSRTDFNGVETCYAYDLTRNLETKTRRGRRCVHRLRHRAELAADGFPRHQHAVASRLAFRDADRRAQQAHHDHLQRPGSDLCAEHRAGRRQAAGGGVQSQSSRPPPMRPERLGFGAGLTGTARTWSYTYTTYGRVLTATDPNGKTTTTTYYPDDDPDLGRRGNVATVTNAASHVTRISAYNLHGQPTQIVDPNGLVTDLTYDLRMRLTSRKVGSRAHRLRLRPDGVADERHAAGRGEPDLHL